MDRKKIVLFCGILLSFFLKANFVLALEVSKYPSFFGVSLDNPPSLPGYVCYLFALLTNLAFLIAVFSIAFGGVYYLVSYGRGKFTDEAKDWIKAGFLGLLIVACATLIAYTINPDLTICKLGPLQSIANLLPGGSSASKSTTPILAYQELPIGTLTETLLTKTTDCYGFGPDGNPIDGEKIANNVFGPTYLDHDRADCLSQLIGGAQRKGDVVAKLTSAIDNLMNQCSCQGKCNTVGCAMASGLTAGIGDQCTGSCSNSVCQPQKDVPDCCPTGVKDKIEHGDIIIDANGYAYTNSVDEGAAAMFNSDDAIPPWVAEDTGGQTENIASAALTETVGSNGMQFTWTPSSSTNNQELTWTETTQTNNMQLTWTPTDTSTNNQPSWTWTQINTNTNNNMQLTWTRTGGGTINAPLTWTRTGGGTNIQQLTWTREVSSQPNSWTWTRTGGTGNLGPTTWTQTRNTGKNKTVAWIEDGNSSEAVVMAQADTSTTLPVKPAGTPYKGLDEFRCSPNPIRDGFQSCDPNEIESFVESQVQVDGKMTTIINRDNWKKLNLVQQMAYFQQKITELKKTIQDDKDNLDMARTALGNCKLAVSSIDMLKTYDGTENKVNIININKFSTPENGAIDASKYCSGFNYDNSSCFKKCNDKCPDTSQELMSCYNSVRKCKQTDANCLRQQQTDIEDCYNSRTCTNSQDTSQTFDEQDDPNSCISSCQDDCISNCDSTYSSSSPEHQVCYDQCVGNSKCILNNTNINDNEKLCLLDAQGVKYCADQNNDPANTQNCINNSYLCKNGSDEYAGYQDCGLKTGDCSAQNTNGLFSASFFYDNPNCQKCQNPIESAELGTPCYQSNTPCQKVCPETSKCPANSNCPYCPCDQINQNITFSVPNQSDKSGNGIGTYSNSQKLVDAHEIVGPQCNSYSYSTDPLTFYCEGGMDSVYNWYTDPKREEQQVTPLGETKICDKEKEVPVGQAVDDAENWADDTMKTADTTNKNIQGIITAAKKAGEAQNDPTIKDYCTCLAKLITGDSTCNAGCHYWTQMVQPEPGAPGTYQTDDPTQPNYYTGTDVFGDPYGDGSPAPEPTPIPVPVPPILTCGCSITQECAGQPCQQVIDYLAEVWNSYKQLQSDYMDFYTTMLQEPRSDIMKELAFSRTQTNSCSLVNDNYGVQAQRLFDCTRVMGNSVPVTVENTTLNGQTLSSYCYGIELGLRSKSEKPLTDNWFCCQDYAKSAGQEKQKP